MCGIVGLYQTAAIRPDQEHQIQQAVAMMRQRGPDDSGIVAPLPELRLGHTRLAIIDLAAGRQPMTDEASGAVITYNGEIFNFREIQAELAAKGHVFRTRCDTEVVLRAYLEWGTACLERFNGFFAFVIFDPRRNELFAARDRLGVKPFYYVVTPEKLAFASAVPPLLAAAELKPRPHLPTVSHYLMTSKTVLGDQTLLDGVLALPPGRFFTVRVGPGVRPEPQVTRYWRFPRLSPAEKLARAPVFADARDRVKVMLEAAVKKRLVSDVPLGSFLSGGIDSAIIALNAARNTDFPLPVFCAGSDDPELNEDRYAELVAAQIQSPLHQVKIDADTFAADMRTLAAVKGLPLSTPNEISIYRLAAELKKHCTVTLTGEGADEIFGGYIQPQFSAYDFDRCGRSPDEQPEDESFALSMIMRHGRSFFINDTDHYTSTCSWMDFEARQNAFRPEVWNTLEDDNAIFAFYEDFFDQLEGLSSFDKRMHLHAEFNLENLLNRVDSSTMTASVEARVPFTDYELAELAFSLPDSYKMDWKGEHERELGTHLPTAEIDRQNLLISKRLPREAFRAELPEAVVNRPKMSFPVPQQKWFTQGCHEQVRQWCLESAFSRQYFNPETVASMVQKNDRNLWLIANLGLWWDLVQA